MRLVDLSHPFSPGEMNKKPENAPEPDVTFETVKSIEKHGVNVLRISLGNHIGTHIDGPMHVIPGGMPLGNLPLETFYGPGVLVNTPKGHNGEVSVSDLEANVPAIQQGDIVLIYTGWGDKLSSPDYPSFHPYLAEEGARWLVNKGVRMVGIDVSSVDLPFSLRRENFKYGTLRILLENGIPVIHNLTNLTSILNKRVTVSAFPINFTGADSSPARVIALVD